MKTFSIPHPLTRDLGAWLCAGVVALICVEAWPANGWIGALAYCAGTWLQTNVKLRLNAD